MLRVSVLGPIHFFLSQQASFISTIPRAEQRFTTNGLAAGNVVDLPQSLLIGVLIFHASNYGVIAYALCRKSRPWKRAPAIIV